MVPKVKKDAPFPPKAETTQRLWRQKTNKQTKTLLPQPLKKDLHVIHILINPGSAVLKSTHISLKEHPQEKQAWSPCQHLVTLDYWVSHEEDRRQKYICVHCQCQGQEHWIKQAVKRSYDIWGGQGQHPDQGLMKRRHMLDCFLILPTEFT